MSRYRDIEPRISPMEVSRAARSHPAHAAGHAAAPGSGERVGFIVGMVMLLIFLGLLIATLVLVVVRKPMCAIPNIPLSSLAQVGVPDRCVECAEDGQ